MPAAVAHNPATPFPSSSSSYLRRSQQSPDGGFSPELMSASPQDFAAQADLDPNNPFVMANDYIKHRLRSVGLEWYDCPDMPDSTDARLAMRLLATDFERRYNHELAGMVAQLSINVDTIYPTFKQIVEQLFVDGINWGRIVALFAFGGAVAAQCMADNRPTLVSQVADWVAVFTRNRLLPWIEQQGGWVSRPYISLSLPLPDFTFFTTFSLSMQQHCRKLSIFPVLYKEEQTYKTFGANLGRLSFVQLVH